MKQVIKERICTIERCNRPVFSYKRKSTSRLEGFVRYKVCRFHYLENLNRRPKHRPIGTKYRDNKGYVYIKIDYGRVVSEHKIIMEEKIGRPLRKAESVHHINGIRDDNRPENLELWVGGIRYGQRAKDIICPHCGSSYVASEGIDKNVI